MGPGASNATEGFDDFNAEGSGFGVALNLFDQAAAPFGQPQAITVTAGTTGRQRDQGLPAR